MDARRGILADFLLATAVLTRLPGGVAVPEDGSATFAAWAFPLVGAGIGLIAAAALAVAESLGLGVAAAPLAILAGFVVTGGLHEDGLANAIDGFGGGRTAERKLAIMRDRRRGTDGVAALVFSIGLRVAAVAAIGDPIHAGLALVAAHAASRGFIAPAMRALPPAREDGLAAAAGPPGFATALVAAVLGAAIAVGCLGPVAGPIAIGGGALAMALFAVLAYRQVGGYTGEVLGAFQQIGEITMLLVAAAT